MNKLCDLTIYTKDKVLLAYIDLCGTKSLYKENVQPIKDKAEKLYYTLLLSFEEVFSNSFKETEIENFLVSIYADSIMICQRITMEKAVERLTEFLLIFQSKLMLKTDSFKEPIPSRALVDKNSFFSIITKLTDKKSILSSEYTTISLCGGEGMVSMDEKLECLPFGVYISRDLAKDLNSDQKKRMLNVKNRNLYFIKQKDEVIGFHIEYLNARGKKRGKTLREDIYKRINEKEIDSKVKDKWEQWISAHEGKIKEIE